VFNDHREKYAQAKDNTKECNNAITAERSKHLKHNQHAYKEVKDKWVNAKNKAVSNWNSDYKDTQEYYDHRIEDVHAVSKEV